MKNIFGVDIFYEKNKKIEILHKDEFGIYVSHRNVIMIDKDKYFNKYCYVSLSDNTIRRENLYFLNFI